MEKKEQLEKLKIRCLDEIKDELSKTANNLVFGKGSCCADVFFIGEAPGKQEDIEGVPFVGKAGKILDFELNSINLSLDKCYIANILKYRPPENRDPKLLEIQSHTPFLVEQIKIIRPKIIITLGNFSTKFILAGFNSNEKEMKKILGISKICGKTFKINFFSEEILVMPIYHPAATLYNPHLKELFSSHIKKIGDVLKN